MGAKAALLCLLGVLAGRALACGGVAEPCKIDQGSYHIRVPDGAEADTPVLIFLHGHGSRGANAISLDRLVNPVLSRGYAVIAPDGLPRNADGSGPQSWNFYPGRKGRDEAAFLKAVSKDAAARFGLSRERVILGGFSAGAFMVNYLACDAPESFAAYTPVAGGFWRPHPKQCAGPVRLFHTHGWTDKTVPLEGRQLGGGRWEQGDIFAGLEIWRAANRCDTQSPSAFSTTGPFMRRAWTTCAQGSALELALFPGAHTVPEGWADMALDWFENLN